MILEIWEMFMLLATLALIGIVAYPILVSEPEAGGQNVPQTPAPTTPNITDSSARYDLDSNIQSAVFVHTVTSNGAYSLVGKLGKDYAVPAGADVTLKFQFWNRYPAVTTSDTSRCYRTIIATIPAQFSVDMNSISTDSMSDKVVSGNEITLSGFVGGGICNYGGITTVTMYVRAIAPSVPGNYYFNNADAYISGTTWSKWVSATPDPADGMMIKVV